MRNEPSNGDDVIDSRDIEERIDELDSEQQALIDEYTEAKEESDDEDSNPSGEATERLCNAINALSDYWAFCPAEVDDGVNSIDDPKDSFHGNEELHELKKFRDEMQPYCEDWHHGTTLIADSYFAEYAEELANDIGAINKDAGWPLSFIDWDAAAEALKADYTSREFDGVTYWAR